MLNRIVIMGRLTADPELRRTGSGVAVTSFTVAVDRDFTGKDSGQKETDFIDCVAWRNTGEFVNSYFTKGRVIVVSGRLQIRSWTDKDGNKRRTAEVVADNCYFGDSNKKEDSNHDGSYYGSAPANGYPGSTGGYPNNTYGAPAPATGGYYPAPTGPSDFAMLEDDDAQLPF